MINELIKVYEMIEHPEGGYFKETYRSEGSFEDRSHSTGIYFLLKEGQKSHFHRIKSDEMWHFYLGDPLLILEIDEEGKLIETVLGRDFQNGMKLQHVVRANRWFASTPYKGSEFSFVGCTVSPGFDFADFELAKRQEFAINYPNLGDHLDFCID